MFDLHQELSSYLAVRNRKRAEQAGVGPEIEEACSPTRMRMGQRRLWIWLQGLVARRPARAARRQVSGAVGEMGPQ